MIFGLLTFGSYGMYSIVTTMFGSMWSILLSAIPLFVFIGVALARSKIAQAGAAFVEAGGTVLTLGYSRVVVALRGHHEVAEDAAAAPSDATE